MKRFYAAAFAALVLGMLAAKYGRTDDPPTPTKLGFLDVKKAFESYRKHKEQIQALTLENDQFIAQLRQRVKQIETESGPLDTMNPETDEAAALDARISLEKSDIDIRKKNFFRVIDLKRRKQEAGVYKEICQEAQAYGAEHGLAAVLLYIPLDADVDKNIDNYLPTRVVLCRDDQLDVTDAVVKRLNNQLPPPKAPPAPPPAKDPPTGDQKDADKPK